MSTERSRIHLSSRFKNATLRVMFKESKKTYDDRGYVIVPGLIESDELSLKLQKACEEVIRKTRDGIWLHRRTVGKQFPPYGDAHPDSWGVQHVMHPDLGEPAFAEWYSSTALILAVQDLLECEEDDLQMELFNLLINPLHSDFALRWHRDDVREDAREEDEQESLNKWHYGVQWNTALCYDDCLFVVPGSHKRPRTREQRVHSENPNTPKDPLDMPGAIQVILNPGETVFYNSNILHCAKYSSEKPRVTLHACIGDVRGGRTRARNVLQHGLEWMREPGFRQSLSNQRAGRMLDRLIELQQSTDSASTGFSLTG